MQKFLETCSLVFGGNFHANDIVAQIVQPYKQSIFIRPGIVRQIFVIKCPIVNKIGARNRPRCQIQMGQSGNFDKRFSSGQSFAFIACRNGSIGRPKKIYVAAGKLFVLEVLTP